MSKEMESFLMKYGRKLEEPIVKNFFKNESAKLLFHAAIQSPCEENIQKLNVAFSSYYKKVRIINYISKLIHFYSIDFDKRYSNYTKRQVLNLDAPLLSNEQTKGNNTKKDILIENKEIDVIIKTIEEESECLKQHVSDERVYDALTALSSKQMEILNLRYIYGLSNKEISETLNLSEQLVSYNHKSAINKLKKSLGVLL